MTVTPPVTLDELKAHLNTSGTSNDIELQMHLGAATEAIEGRVGPIVSRGFAERQVARNNRICLRELPIVSVESLTEANTGTAWDATTYELHPDSGIVIGVGGQALAGTYDIAYTAGRGAIGEVPDRFRLAVLIVAEHLWQTQRGTGARPAMFGVNAETGASSAAAADYVYRGFALPRRALELIANDQFQAFA